MDNQDKRGEQEEQDLREDRNEWFWQRRLDPQRKAGPGPIIFEASRRKRLAERALQTTTAGVGEGPPPPGPPGGAGTVNWTPIGPSVINNGQSAPVRPQVSGRINAIAAGPGNRVYAGAANGGVWYSGDGGLTWAPLDDYSTSSGFISNLKADALSVGALAVAFSTGGAATDDVYVGTGEPGPSDGYFGIGVRHSTSGGAPGSWATEATNLAGRDIYRLFLDPDVAGRVWVATTAGIFQRPLVAPFTTWTQITSATFANSNGAVSDLVIGGTAGARRVYAAFSNDKAYVFDGSNWTALTGIAAGAGRIVLAVGENDPTIVYAFTQNGALYRLVGSAFQAVANVPGASIVTSQGWYDLVLAVDPGDAATVYLAGSAILYSGDWVLPFFKGTVNNVGGTWTFAFNPANNANPTADPTFIGGDVHADGHALAFAAGAGISPLHDRTNVWVGCDGGIFQSTTSGALNSFVARNLGLAITEMTFFAQRQDSDSVLFAGNQDNGNVRFRGEQACYEDPEGDGGGVAVDPNDQYKVMRQYVRAGRWYSATSFYSALSVTTDGGATPFTSLTFPPWTANTVAQRNAVNAEDSATNFYAPIASADAGGGLTRAAFGTNRVWLTENWGGAWVTLPAATNPYVPATPNAAQDVLDGSAIQTVVFASGSRLFAATLTAVWRFDFAAGAWTVTPLTTSGLPASRFITALAVADNATNGSIYITLGYSNGGHVYYLDGAAGSTWQNAGITDATGNINVPATAVVVDPANSTIVYAGTDVGVWQGTHTGAATWTWVPFSQGLPECAVLDLQIHSRAHLLRAATHGRGIWEIEIPIAPAAAGTDDPDIYLRVNYADTGRVRGGTRYSWVEGAQDPTAKGFNVYHWMSADIKVRRGSLSGLPVLGAQANYLDYAFNIGDYIDTSHIETADQAGADRIFVEVHNRGLTPLPAGQVRVLLLITQVGAALPALPMDYAAHINNNDTSSGWLSPPLAPTPWKFADPAMPYRVTTGILDVRTPQVVEFDVDVSTLGLAPGDHVCAAAFITTVGAQDRLTATNTNLDQLTMSDKHVAHRNLHLVAAGARPEPPPGTGYVHQPQTFLIDFHNPGARPAAMDLAFQRPHFPGDLSLLLPKLHAHATVGWTILNEDKVEIDLRSHLGAFLARVGEGVERIGEAIEEVATAIGGQQMASDPHTLRCRKVAMLDRSRVFIAATGSPTIRGVTLAPGGHITAAVTVVAPPSACPGDRFRFDILQRNGDELVGGSTYILEVVRTK